MPFSTPLARNGRPFDARLERAVVSAQSDGLVLRRQFTEAFLSTTDSLLVKQLVANELTDILAGVWLRSAESFRAEPEYAMESSPPNSVVRFGTPRFLSSRANCARRVYGSECNSSR